MSYESFSSMPPEEERQFVVFEEFTRTTAKKASTMGLVAGIGFAVVLIGIVLAFRGSVPKQNFDEPVEESQPGMAPSAAPAAAPAPAPVAPPVAPAGAPVDPAAPAPAGGAAPAPAGGAAPAPAPAGAAPAAPAPSMPPGATKAPPQ